MVDAGSTISDMILYPDHAVYTSYHVLCSRYTPRPQYQPNIIRQA